MKESKQVMKRNFRIIRVLLLFALTLNTINIYSQECLTGVYRDSSKTSSYYYIEVKNNHEFVLSYFDFGSQKISKGEWLVNDNDFYVLLYKDEFNIKETKGVLISSIWKWRYNCKKGLLCSKHKKGFRFKKVSGYIKQDTISNSQNKLTFSEKQGVYKVMYGDTAYMIKRKGKHEGIHLKDTLPFDGVWEIYDEWQVFESNRNRKYIVERYNYENYVRNGKAEKFEYNAIKDSIIIYATMTYKNGLLNGKYKNYHSLYEGNYVNGKKEGLWIDYYPNGNVKTETNYSSDIKNGELTEYKIDGEIISVSKYLNGKLIKTEFYKNDKVIDVKEY